MRKRIKAMFTTSPESWTCDDLKLILEDLEIGGETTKETIKDILKEMEDNVEQCATCGQIIQHEKKPFILEFGPEEMRREAYFCAVDCLQYFIGHVKRLENDREEEL